ncbi:mechanosensitive ion channel [Synechococcus sp. Cruz-9H2]|uniref:mechanosensitive ion channel family protein n=1 Tax=unclassified Synechococcus TaxID=2626047 RepID=UPI0020CE14B0|nr:MULTISPECIES: mechanosensitive ion channel family protein [unclassified Synechococcus]MCP9818831.1 mechanosensitive ion channel [Synechococcus sp. Cruz-9H2]MCP9843334.1 mechanosensitive ion channel [Synechococcus sp. Edmonson 11F2]MCP9855283.1 mechanosensitive ion channel [Synechococcus sp. Cruz-9C9]MCP9862743.1 mechanosensitive ion channel [Synechococcus sp. Cruz-7E5]MCP9869741.1 mechanosensitive ion channel [Synechococcus sp. Cruz-7B9]
MPVLEVWLTAIVLMVLLLPLQLLIRRLRLPKLPIQLATLAILSWSVVRTLPLIVLPAQYQAWISTIDELMFSYLGIRMALWGFLELPAALRLRKEPAQILLQLLMLGGGTVATVIVVQEQARFNLVSLVTTSAVLTAMLGLAAQEPLKDLFAGLELQFDDVFSVGDFLDLGDGTLGVVVSINWRDTCLRDLTGALVVVPNTKVTEVVVRNYVAFGAMGNRFNLGLDYSLPPSRARQLLLDVLEKHPRVLKQPSPAVRVQAFADSAITYDLLAFQQPGNLGDMLDLRSELLEQIWFSLERAGQSVPYPVRELRPKRVILDSGHPEQRSLQERCNLLSRNPLFGDLSEEEMLQLATTTSCLRFAPGEVVVREGNRGDSLFQVVQGQVEVLKNQDNDEPFRVACLKPGDVFGEMSMLTDTSRSATVRALEECVLLEVSRPSLGPLLQQNPPLMNRLAHLVSQRRGELEGMEREKVRQHENQLLKRMKQLFETLTL